GQYGPSNRRLILVDDWMVVDREAVQSAPDTQRKTPSLSGLFDLDPLHTGSRGVDRRSHVIDLLLAERSAREAQSQRELQVLHRSQNLRRGATPWARLVSAMRAKRASTARRLASRKARPSAVIW